MDHRIAVDGSIRGTIPPRRCRLEVRTHRDNVAPMRICIRLAEHGIERCPEAALRQIKVIIWNVTVNAVYISQAPDYFEHVDFAGAIRIWRSRMTPRCRSCKENGNSAPPELLQPPAIERSAVAILHTSPLKPWEAGYSEYHLYGIRPSACNRLKYIPAVLATPQDMPVRLHMHATQYPAPLMHR